MRKRKNPDVRVLVADPDRESRERLRVFLEGKGLGEVMEAATCRQAERLLSKYRERIRLVLLDTGLQSGKRKGVDLLDRMRGPWASKLRGDLRVVLTTSDGELDSKFTAQLAEKEVDYFLKKPVDFDTLGFTLQRWFVEDQKRTKAALHSRQLELRIADREAIIGSWARFGRTPDLKSLSDPQLTPHENPVDLFGGHVPVIEMVATDDYEVDRTASECAEVFGITGLVQLEQFTDAFRSGKNLPDEKTISLHLGPGNGRILKEMKELGSKTQQVGYAKSVLYRPSELFDRLSHYGRLTDEELNILHCVLSARCRSSSGCDSELAREISLKLSETLGRFPEEDLKKARNHLDSLIGGLECSNERRVIGEIVSKLDRFGTLRKFNESLTTLLLASKGRNGRLIIDFGKEVEGKMVDQDRLRQYLIGVAQTEKARALASGDRSLNKTTGRYENDHPSCIDEDEQPLFAEFVADPVAFFRKHYDPTIIPGSTDDLRQFLGLKPRKMIYSDFSNIPENFKDKGTLFKNVYASFSLSHLDDYGYSMAFCETAAHLQPGGVFIDNGFRESYTEYHRIDALKAIRDRLGREYRFFLVGDPETPRSVTVLRGVRDPGDPDVVDFPDLKRIVAEGCRAVPLDAYEHFWPQVALKNRVLKTVREAVFTLIQDHIARKAAKPELARVWQHVCFADLFPKLTEVLNKYANTIEWFNARRLLRRNHNNGNPVSLDDSVKEVLLRFTEVYGDLDTAIRAILERRANEGSQ